MANHVGPNTSHRQGYKKASAMPADSSETYRSLRETTGQNQPQLPETVPYSQQRESTVGEENVTRRKFRYKIVLTSSQMSWKESTASDERKYIFGLIIWKRLVLTQMCNRHALRSNVNKASKQAKRGECLPCERLVQGKMYTGKKALLARHFIALLRSQNLIWIFSIFTSSKFGSLKSRDEIYQKYL